MISTSSQSANIYPLAPAAAAPASWLVPGCPVTELIARLELEESLAESASASPLLVSKGPAPARFIAIEPELTAEEPDTASLLTPAIPAEEPPAGNEPDDPILPPRLLPLAPPTLPPTMLPEIVPELLVLPPPLPPVLPVPIVPPDCEPGATEPPDDS
jgi:hypothetical protein